MADTVERRAWTRVEAVNTSGMARGKLKPGRPAQIVDVSAGGALIETEWRLLPGARVELQVGEPVALCHVKARILRSHIARLHRDRVHYRGALAFEDQLPFLVGKAPDG
jgi:PilZ domain